LLIGVVAVGGCGGKAPRPAVERSHIAVGQPPKEAATREGAKVTGTLELFVPCAFVPPMAEITEAFEKQNPQVKTVQRAGNVEVLVPRVEKGATPDLLLCIGDIEMDRLGKAELIEDRQDFCFIGLALVVPEANPAGIRTLADLARPNVKTVAIGAEGTSPGHYSRELLTEVKLWDKVAPKTVRPKFPSQLLKLVGALHKADAAIAYAACLRAGRTGGKEAAAAYGHLSRGLTLVQALDEGEFCQSVPCPAATVKGCRNRAAGLALLDFMRSDDAQAIFRKFGFTALSDPQCFK
jgi:molybdate transport system substrate-binding protein